MSDFVGRIARLQTLIQEQGAALAVLAGTDQMRYLSGWQEGGHERFVGLLVPAQGEPAFVVPAMNAPQARTTPAGIAQVLGWDDATGWKGEVQSLLRQWRIGQGTALVDDELHSVHLLDLQALFPGLRFEAASATMTRPKGIK